MASATDATGTDTSGYIGCYADTNGTAAGTVVVTEDGSATPRTFTFEDAADYAHENGHAQFALHNVQQRGYSTMIVPAKGDQTWTPAEHTAAKVADAQCDVSRLNTESYYGMPWGASVDHLGTSTTSAFYDTAAALLYARNDRRKVAAAALKAGGGGSGGNCAAGIGGAAPTASKSCNLPETMTAKQACEAVKKTEAELSDGWDEVGQTAVKAGIVAGTGGLGAIPMIIDAFGSKAESRQKLRNVLNSKVTTTTLSNQTASCNNEISVVSSNDLDLTKTCENSVIKLYTILLENNAKFNRDEDDREKKAKQLQDAMLAAVEKAKDGKKKIRMTNTSSTESHCGVNQSLKSLQTMRASIDNQAMQNVLNQASGFMTSSSSDQDICNNIDTEMTACKYIQQSQCCNNAVNVSQSNVFKGCSNMGPIDVALVNSTNNLAGCMLSSDAVAEENLSSDTSNKSTQDAVNKSETPNLLLLFLVGFAVIAISGAFSTYWARNNLLLLLAILACFTCAMTSVGSGYCWYSYEQCSGKVTLRPAVKNAPLKDLSRTNDDDIEGSVENCTWAEAKKNVRDKADVQAVDFFAAVKPKADGSHDDEPIVDDTQGTAQYYTSSASWNVPDWTAAGNGPSAAAHKSLSTVQNEPDKSDCKLFIPVEAARVICKVSGVISGVIFIGIVLVALKKSHSNPDPNPNPNPDPNPNPNPVVSSS